MPDRVHFLKSAGYWFEAARQAQNEGRMGDALSCVENGYNHLENALIATDEALSNLVAQADQLFPRHSKALDRAHEVLKHNHGQKLTEG